MTFTAVITPDPDGGFVALNPETGSTTQGESPDEALAKHYLELGALFVAVGLDTQLLVRHTSALAGRFKNAVPVAASKTY